MKIFGDGFYKVNVSKLAEVSGLSKRKLYVWRDRPGAMPVWAFARLCDVLELSGDDVLQELNAMQADEMDKQAREQAEKEEQAEAEALLLNM